MGVRFQFIARRNGVHAYAITEQRASAFAARGVDGNDSYAQCVSLVKPQATDQLIGQRRFARTAGTRDAHHRRSDGFGLGAQRISQVLHHRALRF